MNIDRDARQETALKELGWRVLVIWECETRNEAAVERRLAASVKPGGLENSRRVPGKSSDSRARRVGRRISIVGALAPSSGDWT